MKRLLFTFAFLITPLLAQVPKDAEKNAALRYWNAFAQMSDQPLATSAEARHLEEVAIGTAPWDEAAFGKLLDDNAGAVESMVQGTTFPYCEWGVNYWGTDQRLIAAMPIPDLGRARALQRLNLLTARRLAVQGKSREATDHLIAGIRFARDLGAGMPLIGVLVGTSLLNMDLDGAADLAQSHKLSPDDHRRLKVAVSTLKPDVFDWSHAVHMESEALRESLLEVKNSPDSARLLAVPDLRNAAQKYPRPTDAELREADAILTQAERLFRQPAAASAPGFAQLASRVEKLSPLVNLFFPPLQRTNEQRQALEDRRKKFQREM